MKSNNPGKKLSLDAETLRILVADELSHVNGGAAVLDSVTVSVSIIQTGCNPCCWCGTTKPGQ